MPTTGDNGPRSICSLRCLLLWGIMATCSNAADLHSGEAGLHSVNKTYVEELDFDWPVTVEVPLPKIPAPKSRCHRGFEGFKPFLVVVAGTRHDAGWLHDVGEDVEGLVYQQDDESRQHYYVKHGNEAGAYLQFIIDYYDCLPNVTAFVHGHEAEGWHSFNMRDTMRELQWHKIPGYTDLNRKVDIWEIDMRNRPKYPSDHPIAMGEEVYSGKYSPRAILGGNAWDSNDMFQWTQQEYNVHAYDKFFGRVGLGAMPQRISFPCCSQFAVTRERVHLRSKHFWQQNLHYLQYNDLQASNTQPKSHMVGDIWTIFWPMLFGESSDYQRTLADDELFKR